MKNFERKIFNITKEYEIDKDKQYKVFPGELAYKFYTEKGVSLEILIRKAYERDFIIDTKEFLNCIIQEQERSKIG